MYAISFRCAIGTFPVKLVNFVVDGFHSNPVTFDKNATINLKCSILPQLASFIPGYFIKPRWAFRNKWVPQYEGVELIDVVVSEQTEGSW